MTNSPNQLSAASVDVLIQRLRAGNAGGLREQAYQSLCGDAADELSRLSSDVAEWKQAASVEAGLRREFYDRIPTDAQPVAMSAEAGPVPIGNNQAHIEWLVKALTMIQEDLRHEDDRDVIGHACHSLELLPKLLASRLASQPSPAATVETSLREAAKRVVDAGGEPGLEEAIRDMDLILTRGAAHNGSSADNEEAELDAWVDSLPDNNDLWCGWHPVHGYGVHCGVHRSQTLIRLTEQNIRLGWEVRRVTLNEPQAVPVNPLDAAWESINALGGTGSTAEELAFTYGIERALEAIEELGGMNPVARSTLPRPHGK